MPSTKSIEINAKTAKAPLRQNGKLRVAAILKAGAEVIAQKGFEAATMAEIAVRSETQIGSLYRFFPSKEILGNALMEHYLEHIDEAFDKLDSCVMGLSLAEFANDIFSLMVDILKERVTVRKLLEAPTSGLSERRGQFRRSIQRHIAKTVLIRCPKMDESLAQDIAVVVLNCMKTMGALSDSTESDARAGAVTEFRKMTEIYFKARLAEFE